MVPHHKKWENSNNGNGTFFFFFFFLTHHFFFEAEDTAEAGTAGQPSCKFLAPLATTTGTAAGPRPGHETIGPEDLQLVIVCHIILNKLRSEQAWVPQS